MVRGGWISAKAVRAFAERCIQSFDVQLRRQRRARAEPLGRQSAEIHRRARDASGAEGAGRRAADLGRRRGRRRVHPPAAARSRRRAASRSS